MRANVLHYRISGYWIRRACLHDDLCHLENDVDDLCCQAGPNGSRAKGGPARSDTSAFTSIPDCKAALDVPRNLDLIDEGDRGVLEGDAASPVCIDD